MGCILGGVIKWNFSRTNRNLHLVWQPQKINIMKIEIHEIIRLFSLQQAKKGSDESDCRQKFEVGIRFSVDRNWLYAIESLS